MTVFWDGLLAVAPFVPADHLIKGNHRFLYEMKDCLEMIFVCLSNFTSICIIIIKVKS